MRRGVAAAIAVAAVAFTAACGSSADADATGVAEAAEAADAPGVRVVDLDTAERLLGEPDRIVIDVRTPGEYDEIRLAGARLIDLQSPTFADDIAALDRELSYLIYCRTANRSASARALMDELDFVDVADVAGGIVAWADAGLPVEP